MLVSLCTSTHTYGELYLCCIHTSQSVIDVTIAIFVISVLGLTALEKVVSPLSPTRTAVTL